MDPRALDRWLTTDPRDTGEECPECGDCEQVETDCNHWAWQCHTVVVLDSAGDPDVLVCRTEHADLYHDPADIHGPILEEETW